jgi:hypothetical protein
MPIIKTQTASNLLAITAVAADAQAQSSVLDLSGPSVAVLEIFHAPDGTGTPTKGTEYRVEVSATATGNDGWVVYSSYVTGLAAATKFDVDGVNAIGTTTIAESATTGLAQDDMIFFKEGTLANSEWRRIVSLTANTSYVINDGLTTATDTNTDVWNKCEKFQCSIPANWIRARVQVNNKYQAGTTIAINCMVNAVVTTWS